MFKSITRRSAFILCASLAATATAQDHSSHTMPAAQTPESILKAGLLNPATFPRPPSPNYGPAAGSISFVDTDPGQTIGGTLTMKPAVDAAGKPVDAAANGITMYMIHWGLEVGAPGTADDAGAGDLGGDCKGFRDTGHVVMMPAADAGKSMSWTIPQGTVVPTGAVYFVGHTLYGKIHNLAKCTQTPINNLQKP
jgi:hypothetical protein